MKGVYWYIAVVVCAGLLGYYTIKDPAHCVVQHAAETAANGYFCAVRGAFVQKGENVSVVPGFFDLAAMAQQKQRRASLRLAQKGWVVASDQGEVLYLNLPEELNEYLMRPPEDDWVVVKGAEPAPTTRCVGSLADVPDSKLTSNIDVMLNRPISTILLLGMTYYAYKLWADRTPVEDVAVSYDAVMNQGQVYRIFTASLAHFDLLHLGFNMMSLYNLAPLEELHGSASYAYLSVGLVIFTQLLCLLVYHVVIQRTQRFELGEQMAVGYSCVLFAWMVDASVKMDKYCPIPFADKFCFDTFGIPTFGLTATPLPANLGPFVLLILLKVVIPKSSFLGHLSGILLGYPLAWGILDQMTPNILFVICIVAYTQAERCWVWSLPGYSIRAPLHEFVEQRQLKIQRLLYVCVGLYVIVSAVYAVYFGSIAGLVRVFIAVYTYMCAEAKRCEWLTDDSMVKKNCGHVMSLTFVALLLHEILQMLNFGATLGASDLIEAYVHSVPYPVLSSLAIQGGVILLDLCTLCVLVLNMVTIPSTVAWLQGLGLNPATSSPTQAATVAFPGRPQTIRSSTLLSSTQRPRQNREAPKSVAPEDLEL